MRIAPSELSGAVERGEFFPLFQPLIELRTGQVAGFEVLARWAHPQLGLVMPDQFIPAAESCGAIHDLTRSILEKAFALRFIGPSPFSLSVNISPLQLRDLHLPNAIAEVAEHAAFPLSKLQIEITETALVEDIDRAAAVVQELKRLGCRLALDDFGTGYSSLNHLHSLPFDVLKVDKSFVALMTTKRSSRKIVASVIGLGQSLGCKTVAEGVETEEQFEMLLRMGCDLAQGWLFAKALEQPQAEKIVASGTFHYPVPHARPVSEEKLGVEGPPGQRLAHLQAIYDGAPVGLCFLDSNMRYVALNRRLAELNGIPAESHLGRTVCEVVPVVFQQVGSYIRRALAGECISGVEIHKPATNRNDTQILICSYQPVRDEAREVIGVSVAVMNVTESRRTEETLREVEEHFRSMLKLSPHVPWVLNERGEVIEAGQRWEVITGQPLCEALGVGWLGAVHPDDLIPVMDAVTSVLQTGASIDIRLRVRRANGDWIWMRSRGEPRFSETGRIVGVYGAIEEMEEVELPRPVAVRKTRRA